MFNRTFNWPNFSRLFSKKKKDIEPCGIKSTVTTNYPTLEVWIKETNAGLGYNKHVVFEDPAYVSTTGDMQEKYKIELCKKAQEQYKNSNSL